MIIVSDATIWSITLEASITLPQASFMAFVVQATGATIVNYNYNTFILQATGPIEDKR
jgi:hypothetical protein